MIRRTSLAVGAVVLMLLAGGCGPGRPTLAGGKPVAYWVAALQEPSPPARRKAVRKLGNVGRADAAVVPALLRALKDPDAGVRREAVWALAKLGRDAEPAVHALAELGRQDGDPRVRAEAARLLERLRREGVSTP
jgi:HEAT repeat protein